MTREEFLKTFPALSKNYRPAPDVLKQIAEVRMLIVIGPSGAGKTSIIDRLDIPYVPTDVTRPPRPEEKDGVDMFFRTDYDRLLDEIKTGRFLQFVVGASGDFYGTRASSYPKSGWAAAPIIADTVPLFRRLGFKDTLSIFIVPPSYDEWMRRMGTHEIGVAETEKRLAEARRSLDFALSDSITHFILNDDLDRAVEQTKILLGGTIDKNREAQAKDVAAWNRRQLAEGEN